MKTFTTLHRKEQLENHQNEIFDLLIIGGGITGAGIALDAVTRGMKVALLEKQDFAEGTSSRSTKLVHGGLRYLKQFHVKEVAQLGRERAIVYENGPHVTTPVWMLLPFYKGGTFGSLTTSLGLKVYDILAGVKKGERRFMLNKEDALKREPLLNEKDLIGGGIYVEYRTDDARLTIEVLKAANQCNAHLFHYMEATGIVQHEDHYHVEAYDRIQQEKIVFKGKKVVNAAGPWIDEVRAKNGDEGGKHLILSKGVHLVFDQKDFPLKQAIYFDVPDGRMIFAIPRSGKTYVGTTDTFYDGSPDSVSVNREDVEYLLNAINSMFPHIKLNSKHIESSWAGVRPLIQEEGKGASEISRKDEIWIAENGVITIAGGKLTGYRKMAQDVVDVVVKQFLKERRVDFGKSVTKKMPISGGDISSSKFFEQYVAHKTEEGIKIGLTASESEQLVKFYGTNVDIVYKFVQGATGNLPPYLYGRLHYSIYYESVSKAVDFFVRRTGQLYFDINDVIQNAEDVIGEMAEIFGWNVEQVEHNRVQLMEAIKQSSLQ